MAMEFDLNTDSKPEMAARMVGAILQARIWLDGLREVYGVSDVIRTETQMPFRSYRLSYQLSARFFAITETAMGMPVLSIMSRESDGDLMEDAMAWFPLIPWSVEIVRESVVGESLLVLRCPKFSLHQFKSNEWELKIPFNYRVAADLLQFERFGLWRNGRYMLGWKPFSAS